MPGNYKHNNNKNKTVLKSLHLNSANASPAAPGYVGANNPAELRTLFLPNKLHRKIKDSLVGTLPWRPLQYQELQ